MCGDFRWSRITAFFGSYAYLASSRKIEVFGYIWAVSVGSLMASRGFPPAFPTILVILSTLAIALCVYVYNDITDTEMDRLNPIKKERPLPSGKATKQDAIRLVYLTGSLGLALSFFINLGTFLLCTLWLVLFLAYSMSEIRLKRRFLWKEGTVAIGFFLSVLTGALAAGSISTTVVFAAIFFGLFIFSSVPAFRDTTDINEDRLYGVKSLASILRWKQRLELLILFVLATMTLTPLTYANFGFNMILPIVVVAMGFLHLRYLFPLLNRLEEKSFSKATKLELSYFIFIPISMIIGSFPIAF